jgi:hypothetical protein
MQPTLQMVARQLQPRARAGKLVEEDEAAEGFRPIEMQKPGLVSGFFIARRLRRPLFFSSAAG